MLNVSTTMPGTSMMELSQDELDMIGGGVTTMVVKMVCKIDDSGNGTCTTESYEKED